MPKPQQPELRRSENQGFDPDSPTVHEQAGAVPGVDAPGGPVPVDNLPGHHPDHEQDKPSGDDFVAKVKARAAEADAETGGETPANGRNGAGGRAKGASTPSTTSRGRTAATAATQTSAPKADDRPVAAVTPISTRTTPPAPRPAPPPWVRVAAGVAGAPFRITAEVLKLLRRAL